MKKFLIVLFVFVAANLPGFAYITTEEAISEEYIQNHGYSDEMSRLIDLQNAQINGEKSKYVGKDPEWYNSNKPVKFIRKVMMYFDCGLDDGKFMQNNIDYTTRYDDL